MANPTLTVKDAELDMFDDILKAKSNSGERPQKPSRSAELRTLVQKYILENMDVLEESDDWEYYQMYLGRTDEFGEFPRPD